MLLNKKRIAYVTTLFTFYSSTENYQILFSRFPVIFAHEIVDNFNFIYRTAVPHKSMVRISNEDNNCSSLSSVVCCFVMTCVWTANCLLRKFGNKMSSLCYEGKLSLVCFLGTSVFIFALYVSQVLFIFTPNVFGAIFWGPFFYFALLNMFLRFFLRGFNYQIAVRASFLGFAFVSGILGVLHAPMQLKPFGLYAMLMSVFHYGEFLGIAWSNPRSLCIDSFILNHSVHYTLAAVCSWAEYFAEVVFFPNIKEYQLVWITGVLICIAGEFMRKLAMITANSNFNHLVQFIKSSDHELITHGIYSVMRHPSYVGFFWWSIGTQIVLFNPLCILLYAAASWKFFNDRIYLEEITLLNFFGKQYYDYQQRVSTGIPFISGYQIEQN